MIFFIGTLLYQKALRVATAALNAHPALACVASRLGIGLGARWPTRWLTGYFVAVKARRA
ncbi:MAG: hypothetical protein FJ395_00465 [Verrucomicrobia bacterium]|nr:hypothetical protein [Verrucomicrobiota bacterium]